MPFDPSQPFEEVGQSQSMGFDPSQPFEEVKQGGELKNVKDQTRANTDRNAGREGNQQVGNLNEANNPSGERSRILQERGSQYSSKDGGQETQAQLTPTGFDLSEPFEEVKGGETSSEKNQQTNAQGDQGQENGQGVRSQSPARNKEEVVGSSEGVPSPSTQSKSIAALGSVAQGGLQVIGMHYGGQAGKTLVKNIATQAAKKAGAQALGTAIGEAIGLPIAAAEEIGSAGLATPLAIGTEVGAALLGGWVGGKVEELGEWLTRTHGSIQKAQQENPLLSKVVGAAVQLPFGIKSAQNLIKLAGAKGGKAVAETMAVGGAAGAAMYPLQVGFNKVLNHITGQTDDEHLSWGGALESAVYGVALGGLGLPETGKAIDTITTHEKTKQKINEASKDPHPEVEAALAEVEKHIESGDMKAANEAYNKASMANLKSPLKGDVGENRNIRMHFLAAQIEDEMFGGGKKKEEQTKKDPTSVEQSPERDSALASKWEEMMSHPEGSEERKRLFEEYINISKGKEKEQGITQEPPRLQEAAYIATNKKGETKIFTGENHDEALDNALKEGFIEEKQHAALKGDKSAKRRNTPEFGFIDQNGEFHDRKTAKQIAEESGQLNTEKFSHQDAEGNALLHSHEVELDKYKNGGHGEIESGDIHGKTIREALNVALEHESASPKIKAVIKALLSAGSKKLDGDLVQAVIKEGTLSKRGKPLLGRRVEGEVHIPEKGKVGIKTLVHEALHTHTADELYKHFPYEEAKGYTGKAYVDWLTKKSSGSSVPAPIKRIAKLYKSYLEQSQKIKDANLKDAVIQYGDMNIHEFISEAFSNNRFQSTLRTLKGDRQKSLFRSIVDSLKQMLRVKGGSMLESVLDAGLGVGGRSGEKGVRGSEELDESGEPAKKKWGAGISFLQKKGQIVRESLQNAKMKAMMFRQESQQGKASKEAYQPAKGFIEDPKGKNVLSAAYRNPTDGKIYEGKTHQEAMENAGVKGDESPENMGYYTNLGEFISGEKANELAKTSGQINASGEINLSGFYRSGEKAGERRAEPISFSERPAEAVMQQFMLNVDSLVKNKDVAAEIKDAMQGNKATIGLEAYTELQNTMRKMGLTHDDLDSLGINLPETGMKARIVESMKSGIMQFVDFFDNKITPKLQKANAYIEARAYAASPELVNRKADMLLAEVFPEWYKNENHPIMKKATRFLVNDNILGGYDKAKEHLAALREKYANPDITEKQKQNLGKAIKKQDNFIKAIEEVRDIQKLNEETESLKNDQDVLKAVENWKTHVTPVMEDLYRVVKGLRPDEKIPEGIIEESRGRHSGVRINLLPEAGIEKLMNYFDDRKTQGDGVDISSFQSPEVANFQNPNVKRDKNSLRANFLGNYSEDPKLILLNSLGSRYQNAAKINLYRKLVDTGFAYMVEKGEAGPKLINGKPVYKMPSIKFPFFNYETGETDIREVNYYTQADMRGEIEQLLDVNTRFSDMPVVSTISKALNATQMVGIADGVAHLLNILRVATAALGKDSFGKDLMGKIPGFGSVRTIKELRDLCKEASMDSKEWRAEVSKLADLGLIRSTHPAEGIVQRFIGIHDMIHDADLAARVFMSRRFDEMVKRGLYEDTPENKINFVSQVGEYNSRLNGRFLQALKDIGLSPFMTAGRAMTRASIRLLTGSSGARAASDKANLQIRAANMMGLVFATTLPMTINMFTTGSAFGRKGVPIGAIDFGPNADTEDGKHRILDIFQLVGLRRAMRALGINSAVEGLVNGLPMDQISLNMKNDIFTTIAHPFVGPAAGFLVEGTTGNRIDLRTGYGQSFSSRKIDNEWGQLAENFRVAVKHLNPLAYGLMQGPIQKGMESMGIPKDADETTTAQATGEALLINPAAAAGLNLKGVVSPATKLANQLGQKVQYTPEQSIRYQARKNVNDLVKAGKTDEAKQIYNQYKHDGVLKASDDRILKMQFKERNPLVLKVRSLKTADDAIQVYRVSTPEEQDAIRDVIARKVQGSQVLNDSEKKRRYEIIKQYAKKGSQLHAYLNQQK